MIKNKLGRGRYTYSFDTDLLIYKIDDIPYQQSLEYENLLIDLGPRGVLSGIRVFDASIVFGVSKQALIDVKNFALIVKITRDSISVIVRFDVKKQSKTKTCEQSFVTQELTRGIQESEMVYTA